MIESSTIIPLIALHFTAVQLMIFPKQRNGGKVEWPNLNTNEIVEEAEFLNKARNFR